MSAVTTPHCLSYLVDFKMKHKQTVTTSARKQRKAALGSHSLQRRKLMSAHLSKELRDQHNVRRIVSYHYDGVCPGG